MHSLKKGQFLTFWYCDGFFRLWILCLADPYVSPNISLGYIWPSRTLVQMYPPDMFGLFTTLAGTRVVIIFNHTA